MQVKYWVSPKTDYSGNVGNEDLRMEEQNKFSKQSYLQWGLNLEPSVVWECNKCQKMSHRFQIQSQLEVTFLLNIFWSSLFKPLLLTLPELSILGKARSLTSKAWFKYYLWVTLANTHHVETQPSEIEVGSIKYLFSLNWKNKCCYLPVLSKYP